MSVPIKIFWIPKKKFQIFFLKFYKKSKNFNFHFFSRNISKYLEFHFSARKALFINFSKKMEKEEKKERRLLSTQKNHVETYARAHLNHITDNRKIIFLNCRKINRKEICLKILKIRKKMIKLIFF